MATERDYGQGMPGAEFLIYVSEESLAARQSRRALRHGGAGSVKAAKRQDVDLTHQVGDRTGDELLSQLLVALFGGVSAGAALESVRPLVVGRAVASVSKGAEVRTFRVGTHGVEVGVAGGVGDDVGYRYAKLIVYG